MTPTTADDRTAVVTGANRGIGLEVARRLAARSGTTVVLGRNAGSVRAFTAWAAMSWSASTSW